MTDVQSEAPIYGHEQFDFFGKETMKRKQRRRKRAYVSDWFTAS